MRRKVLGMFGVTLTDFSRNNCPYVAAGIAYWTLFSLFPLALGAIALLGVLNPTDEEQARVVEELIDLVPVSTDYLAQLVREVTDARGALGGVALAGVLLTGTAMFSAVRKGVNHAWHTGKPPYFLFGRAIDLVMLVLVAAVAFVHIVFYTNLLGLAGLGGSVGESAIGPAVKLVLQLVGLAATVGAFLLLYRYVPNTVVYWRDIWLGAVIGAALFTGVRFGVNYYISNFSRLNIVYGSMGGIMAVLVWAYLSALAIMLGAQVSYTYRGVFGSQAGTVDLPRRRRRLPFRRRRRLKSALTTVAGWLLPPKDGRGR